MTIASRAPPCIRYLEILPWVQWLESFGIGSGCFIPSSVLQRGLAPLQFLLDRSKMNEVVEKGRARDGHVFRLVKGNMFFIEKCVPYTFGIIRIAVYS